MKSTAQNPVPELPRYLRGPFRKTRAAPHGFHKLYRAYESAHPCPTLQYALTLYRHRDNEVLKDHLEIELPALKAIARQAIMERRNVK